MCRHSMRLGGGVAWCLALAGCAPTPTLVDMTDVDPVVYQRALDRCEAIGIGNDPIGPLVAGAVMGASIGAGMGALIAGPAAGISGAEAIGGASGAVAGAGVSAAVTASAKTDPTPPEGPQSVADCLRARGYKVLGQR
jgi:hypothetical protein